MSSYFMVDNVYILTFKFYVFILAEWRATMMNAFYVLYVDNVRNTYCGTSHVRVLRRAAE